MFSLQGVSKKFDAGTQALRGITADIAPGEFVALLGPSGCGKSTLLRLLAGLEEPSEGRIDWDQGGRPKPGEIGFVFQDATLLPWASVAENVYLPLRLRGRKRAEAAGLIHATLARVGLEEFAKARPKTLSGGMRMRVSIARALVSDPVLLLMDEPFAALDEFTRHRLQEDLRAVWRQTGKTVVFVTHSIYEAAFLASRILVMSPRPGQIVADLRTPAPVAGFSRREAGYAAFVAQVTDIMRQESGT